MTGGDNMKKIISLITALMLSAARLAGCGSTGSGSADQTDTQENSGTQTQEEPVDVNVMALKGPTAMAGAFLPFSRTVQFGPQCKSSIPKPHKTGKTSTTALRYIPATQKNRKQPDFP